MFFDLNIVYDKGSTNAAKEAVNTAGLRMFHIFLPAALFFAVLMTFYHFPVGYNTVALNYILRGKPGSPDVRNLSFSCFASVFPS
jgi:hypothetical protein